MDRRFLDESEIAEAIVSAFGLRLDRESVREAAAIAVKAAADTG